MFKRIFFSLIFNQGILFRSKKFNLDYRYTHNFVNTWSVDEIIIINLDKKKKIFINRVNKFISNLFVPLSIGGGISNVQDAKQYFDCGADKIIINSIIFKKKNIIRDLAKNFGAQSIIVSIDVRKLNSGYYVFIDNGKKNTNIKIEKYLKDLNKENFGEIYLNSIDFDGSLKGYDIQLYTIATKISNKNIIAAGGCGNWSHFYDILKLKKISGASTSNIYHFSDNSVNSAKKFLKEKKIKIRI